MIRRALDKLLGSITNPGETEEDAADRAAAIRSATAVLLIDVARADDVFDEIEFEQLLRLLESHFQLQPELAAALVNEAGEKAEDMVSLYEFTKTLHAALDEKEKAKIVLMLWQLAYADGRLDKYEDALVLKISDLLHVSRGRVMRLKHDAKTSV